MEFKRHKDGYYYSECFIRSGDNMVRVREYNGKYYSVDKDNNKIYSEHFPISNFVFKEIAINKDNREKMDCDIKMEEGSFKMTVYREDLFNPECLQNQFSWLDFGVFVPIFSGNREELTEILRQVFERQKKPDGYVGVDVGTGKGFTSWSVIYTGKDFDKIQEDVEKKLYSRLYSEEIEDTFESLQEKIEDLKEEFKEDKEAYEEELFELRKEIAAKINPGEIYIYCDNFPIQVKAVKIDEFCKQVTVRDPQGMGYYPELLKKVVYENE